ncbi:cytochrome P450 9e2-like [Neocloeon triangulifer]|uniref:cytochrome P450 9e2-like n=1 Tax=Neocloeon triangulifer TaxID=2078957 RepID=UPI00286F820A|nr:cytochrome P450 9e2-like [Neocloeon triangulifer]
MLDLLANIPFGVKVTCTLLGLIIYLGYKFITKNFDYWQKQNVKFLKPVPVFGSISSVFLQKEHLCQFMQRAYHENEGEPFVGYFQGMTPTLLAIDPELIKKIFVKDFSHFVDHGFQFSEEADPLQAKNLFHLGGQRWKDIRTKLIPTFTSGKIKSMFPLINECNEKFDEYLEILAERNESFEAKDLLGRLFTDIVGSCIFGIECNSIQNPDNQFRSMGKRLTTKSVVQAFKVLFVVFIPKVFAKFNVRILDKDVTEYFKKVTKDMAKTRKERNIVRKDFLQLLIELKDKGSVAIDEDDEDKYLKKEAFNQTTSNATFKFDDIDLAAQSTVFFLAGFETSSTLICFTLLELAMNQDVQRKAQSEVDKILSQSNGKITYEILKEIKYLDWILKEALRKYPPVALHMRMCTKTYKIPDTKVTLQKGTFVAIPNYALQNDPKYFPDPDRFDPERFSDEELMKKYQYIYTPFGEGPRQCIGNRFAQVQSKLALFTFLRKYTVSKCPETEFPVKIEEKQFIVTSKSGIFLKIEKRNNLLEKLS